MKLPSFLKLSAISTSLKKAFLKFPFSILVGISASILFIILIENDFQVDGILGKLFLTFFLAMPVFTSVRLVGIKYQWSWNWKEGLMQLLGLGVLLIYFWSLPERDIFDDNITVIFRFLGLLTFFHLLISFLPYINSNEDGDFWEYNKQLFANWLIGAFYGLIIFLGLALALLALDNLFGVEIKGIRYAQLFGILAGIFHPIFFFSTFPEDFKFSQEERFYDKIFANLSQYILIPLVLLYLVILYAFGTKILVTWNLPQGWIASLIMWMAVIGILTYLLQYKLTDRIKGSLSRFFHKNFWMMFLPLIALIAVAIARRIGDYGITEPRYIVVNVTVSLFIITVLNLLLNKVFKRNNIIWVPMVLAFFTLITILGPINAMKLSEKSQVGRMVEILNKADLMEEGKIKFEREALSDSLKREIESIFDFLDDRNKIELLSPFLSEEIKENHEDWTISTISNELGLNSNYYSTPEFYYNWYSNTTSSEFSLNIQAYKSMIPIDYFEGQNSFIKLSGMEILRNGEVIGSLESFIEKEIGLNGPQSESSINKPIDGLLIIPLDGPYDLAINRLNIQEKDGKRMVENVVGFLLEKE